MLACDRVAPGLSCFGVDFLLNVEYYLNTMSRFGETLREKRRASGLSQRQLASRLGLDFSYISKIENGRLPAPAAETVVRIAEILDCPVEELLAAARKLTDEMSTSLTAEAMALRFVQEASRMGLSGDEWERLLGSLHGLRSDAKEEGRR
jgi:transcriptional regulator with XRE-family HTH domain